MKPRHKRAAIIVGGLATIAVAAALILNAFQSNLVFFFTPSQVLAGEAPKARTFRVGGLNTNPLLPNLFPSGFNYLDPRKFILTTTLDF